MSGLYRYIGDHWRGHLPMEQAFWINYVALAILMIALEPLCFPFVNGETAVTIAFTGYLLLTKLGLFSWQAIGLLRGSRGLARSNRTLFTLIQASILLGLGSMLLTAIDGVQSLQLYKQGLRQVVVEEPSFTLEYLPQSDLLHLKGTLEIGITSRVRQWLESHPPVSGIILDSDGGQVYEGRGLALQIRLYALDTYTLTQCLSSCTTAFIAGRRRSLGRDARLGFHRYKTYVGFPVIDVDEEQRKDRRIFLEQGVPAEFIDRMYSYPPGEMWWPSTDELLAAGIVHDTGFEAGD